MKILDRINFLLITHLFFSTFLPGIIMSQTAVIAHRGSSGTAPENTLAAFKFAIESGADFIELDVHLSKDGELIVMHDESVNRTTNGKGKIKELSLDQIKKLDAGKWFDDSFTGMVVPTLDEVFRLPDEKIKFLIEIKGTPKKYPGIEKKVADKIARYRVKNRCILQSFNLEFLKNFHTIDSTFQLHYLVVGKVFPENIPGYIRAVNPNFHFVTAKKISKLHKANRTIFVWTVNDERKMKKLLELGVDGIITNFPGKLKAITAVSGTK